MSWLLKPFTGVTVITLLTKPPAGVLRRGWSGGNGEARDAAVLGLDLLRGGERWLMRGIARISRHDLQISRGQVVRDQNRIALAIERRGAKIRVQALGAGRAKIDHAACRSTPIHPATCAVSVTFVRGPALSVATVSAVWVASGFRPAAAYPVQLHASATPRSTGRHPLRRIHCITLLALPGLDCTFILLVSALSRCFAA